MRDGVQAVLTLRAIQNYFYCPRRWGLMNVERIWQDNHLTALGDVVHERVSDPFFTTVEKNRVIERNVPVYNDAYGIEGALDCLEIDFRGGEGAGFVKKYGRRAALKIVEYKKRAPKDTAGAARRADRMQLLGQKICVDAMFGCDCQTEFYYADIKRRSAERFCAEDYEAFGQALEEMRRCADQGKIPQPREDRYCGGCSFAPVCLPDCRVAGSVRRRIGRDL